MTQEEFHDIETRWRKAFVSPYVGRALLADADNRVELAVFDGDGKKVWELRENPARFLTDPASLDSIAEDARKSLSP